MLRRSVRLRIALLTAIALLVAQWGAEAHAYSHVHPVAQVAQASHPSDQYDSNGRLCADCSAFAPLLASADGPTSLFGVIAPGVPPAPDVAVRSLVSRLPTSAFRSRAPPLHP